MVRNFKENFFGRPDFPPKRAPSTGQSCFPVFRPGPGFLQGPQAQKPLNRYFRPVGVRPKKRSGPRKLQKTIPRIVSYHFVSIPGPLWLWGPPGALRGQWLLACCCLPDAQAPPRRPNGSIHRLKYCVLPLGGLTLTGTWGARVAHRLPHWVPGPSPRVDRAAPQNRSSNSMTEKFG